MPRKVMATSRGGVCVGGRGASAILESLPCWGDAPLPQE